MGLKPTPLSNPTGYVRLDRRFSRSGRAHYPLKYDSTNMSNNSQQKSQQAASKLAISSSEKVILPAFKAYVEQQSEATAKQPKPTEPTQPTSSEKPSEEITQPISNQKSISAAFSRLFKKGKKADGKA
ncbi:MAG: hypothetical protein H7126_15785 [Candidatus Parcubacteria bacterium]|nr:hypothetical protein [Leptolyngbyaceae cyanobacterium LF-bin-113]